MQSTIATTRRKHYYSRLLSKQTFRRILERLPPNIEIRAVSPVRVYHDFDGIWKKYVYGAVALVKDYNIRRFCIYIISLPDCQRVSSATLYAKFDYFVDHKYFHQYRTELDSDECHLGLHFPNGTVGYREAFKLAENVIHLLKKSGDKRGMSRFFEDVYSPNGSPDHIKNGRITADSNVYGILHDFEGSTNFPSRVKAMEARYADSSDYDSSSERNYRRIEDNRSQSKGRRKRSDALRKQQVTVYNSRKHRISDYEKVGDYTEELEKREAEKSDESDTEKEDDHPQDPIRKRGRKRNELGRPVAGHHKVNSFENDSTDEHEMDRDAHFGEGKRRGNQKEKFWASIRSVFGALGKNDEEQFVQEHPPSEMRGLKKNYARHGQSNSKSQQSCEHMARSLDSSKIVSRGKMRFQFE